MKITDKLVLFFSNKDILSNFYPCTIMYNGLKFHCSEQLFMYLKAIYFNDEAMANNILNCKTPQEAKQYGRCVRGYDENSWNNVRDEQMFIALKAKYDSVFKFREFLNEHKDKKFAEASPYDKIWGIGLKETDTDATNPKRWLGENRLGKCIDRIIQENCNNGNS